MRGELNDAASMSSMDSYGYSLDGYAPSLSGGTPMAGYPATQPSDEKQLDDVQDEEAT